MTDYMQKAREFYHTGATVDELQTAFAATLEALDMAEQAFLEAKAGRDTANTRADAAEKRERDLREGLAHIIRETTNVTRELDNYAMCIQTVNSHARELIQPEPDPLVEIIAKAIKSRWDADNTKEAEETNAFDFEPGPWEEWQGEAQSVVEALAKHGLSIVKGKS